MDSNTIFDLLMIIGLDLVLAGDNAVVIGMASRNLPLKQRKKAILWGTAAAVVIRILMIFVAVQLLNTPLVMAIGGLLLIWVAIKLLIEEDDDDINKIKGGKTLSQAVMTIVMADIIMGLDNVIAVAGASHGNILLIVVGIAVSIPIVVGCSGLISSVMNKYPSVVYIGAGLIAYTAALMITSDPIVKKYLFTELVWIIEFNTVLLVILIGKWIRWKKYAH